MTAIEANFDGLIGPTHNYGGLSDGNLASAKNAGDVSRPRDAALQGLEKMRAMLKAGLVQGVLPPHPRPHQAFLTDVGFPGSVDAQVSGVAATDPRLLKVANSASAMWTANAATVSPSADTSDGRVHFTPANLSTMLHRSAEWPFTRAILGQVFADSTYFAVHDALPSHESFADEGAANHVRLCAAHGEPGVELFVYGRETGESGLKFPARQTRLASFSVARSHGLEMNHTVMARQSAKAIEAGAFHNDVVCVGTLDTLFFHEDAFEHTDDVLAAISTAAARRFSLRPVMVPAAEVPLSDAISAYLFNSQLLQMPGEDRLVLVAPTETRDTPSTAQYCAQLVAGNGPIGRVEYVDVRQSMRNGGGPACLRLRVVLTPEELDAVHPGVVMTEAKIDALQAVVAAHYRETLSPEELADPRFAEDAMVAHSAIMGALGLAMPS